MQLQTHEEMNRKAAVQALESRGVYIDDIAELVGFLQKDYFPDLEREECHHHIMKVLSKREIQNAILTGICLDKLAEEGRLESPLQEMIEQDEALYGSDETLALSIVNVYGSIGMTNFGFIDKMKPGILHQLNEGLHGRVHTFLDDIVGAVAAAASSRIAHKKDAKEVIPITEN